MKAKELNRGDWFYYDYGMRGVKDLYVVKFRLPDRIVAVTLDVERGRGRLFGTETEVEPFDLEKALEAK